MCMVRIVVALVTAIVTIRAFGLEPDQVYAKVAPSIVVVFGYNSSTPDDISFGSGVIIAPGQIVTNCHVVEDADVIYVTREKVRTLGIVRYSDPDRDLCQIGATDIKGFERAVSLIASTDELRVGQKVYAIGAPQGLELTLSDGLISSLRVLPIGTIIQTNAPVSKGSSGGGLFDTTGRLIGITSFIFKSGQNLNFAVPATWISDLRDRHQAREETARKIMEVEAADQARAEEERRREEEARNAEEHKRLEEERKEHALAMERARQQDQVAQAQRETEEAQRRAEAEFPSDLQKVINEWKERIQAKIKSRVLVPANIRGNAEAHFEVVLLPGGEVLSATLRKSSGVKAYDAAVERAIMAAQPLPVPPESEVFQKYFREILLRFRPSEGEGTLSEPIVVPLPLATPPQPVVLAQGPSPPAAVLRLLVIYGQSISKLIQRFQKYPPLAQRRGWEGTPEVQLQIAADGKVTRITLGKSCGRSVLDEEALNMVRRALPLPLAPLELRGRELTVTMPIVFKLQES